MLRTPMILGISMAPRKNRRVLVAVTYASLLALMVTIVIFPPLGDRNVIFWFLLLAFGVVSVGVLGKLVEQTAVPPPQWDWAKTIGLGLAVKRRDADEPDEREVAVRNAAYFEAYRPLAVYSLVVCFASPICLERLSGSVAVIALELFTMPLLAMIFTLPQAIIVWTEPDVPEEARV